MKYLLAIFFFISLAATVAQSAERLSGEQARRVLGAIDDRCGDTWCEGDYQFAFIAVRPAADDTYAVQLRMTPFGGVAAEFDCLITGHAYEDLVRDDGRDAGLRPGPYRELNECIGAHQN
jgi:hypothetical protein